MTMIAKLNKNSSKQESRSQLLATTTTTRERRTKDSSNEAQNKDVKKKLEEEEDDEEFVGNGIRAGNRWKMNSIMSLYKALLGNSDVATRGGAMQGGAS